MSNIAIINLEANFLKLKVFNMDYAEFPYLIEEVLEPIDLYEDLIESNMISTVKFNYILKILKNYKKMIKQYNVEETIAIMPQYIRDVKNEKSFFEQLTLMSGIRFNVLNELTKAQCIASGVNLGIEYMRGTIIEVGAMETSVIFVNKKASLKQFTMPIGSVNLAEKLNSSAGEIESFISAIKEELAANFTVDISAMHSDMEMDNYKLIIAGNSAMNLGTMLKKRAKYSFDIMNNFSVNRNDFDTLYNMLKEAGIDATKSIKGLNGERSNVFFTSLTIYKYFFDLLPIKDILLTDKDKIEGYLTSRYMETNMDKTLLDLLTLSSDANCKYYNESVYADNKVVEMAINLFRESKAIHRFGKSELKILKAAAIFARSGKRIGNDMLSKKSYSVIMQIPVSGLTHREHILAGFVILSQNFQDFNMSDWVKHKDILEADDLNIVRKLACILKMAMSFEMFDSGAINTIDCDVLGDSVIIKTISDVDIETEKRSAMQVVNDFKKAFGKDLTIF